MERSFLPVIDSLSGDSNHMSRNDAIIPVYILSHSTLVHANIFIPPSHNRVTLVLEALCLTPNGTLVWRPVPAQKSLFHVLSVLGANYRYLVDGNIIDIINCSGDAVFTDQFNPIESPLSVQFQLNDISKTSALCQGSNLEEPIYRIVPYYSFVIFGEQRYWCRYDIDCFVFGVTSKNNVQQCHDDLCRVIAEITNDFDSVACVMHGFDHDNSVKNRLLSALNRFSLVGSLGNLPSLMPYTQHSHQYYQFGNDLADFKVLQDESLFEESDSESESEYELDSYEQDFSDLSGYFE
jgi:hypothetical protein